MDEKRLQEEVKAALAQDIWDCGHYASEGNTPVSMGTFAKRLRAASEVAEKLVHNFGDDN